MKLMRGRLLSFLALMIAVSAAVPAAAQSESYLPPFPENDTYRLQVIGDSLADGLLGGMLVAFAGEGRLQIQRRTRGLNGLTRQDSEEALRAFEDSLATDNMHIAVVMLGAYDRAAMRLPNGKRVTIGSDEWRAEYGRRVDRLMKALKRRNAAVYWVSLPVLRRADWSDDASEINEIIRERAGANALRFIDIFNETADDAGNYSPYGADIAGKSRRLREADGIHFTQTGNRKLAFYLERELRRDLTQAMNERATPLAGSESEQRRLIPLAAPVGDVAKGQGDGATSSQSGGPLLTRPGDRGSGPRADNSKVSFKAPGTSGREEQVTIDILRPAIPATVIALLTRRASADHATPVGDTVTDTLQSGITVMRSLTLSATPGLKGQRVPATQMPFFRALVKGERQTPRAGRADDFGWPRDDEPASAPAETTSQPPPPDAKPTLKTSGSRGSAPRPKAGG